MYLLKLTDDDDNISTNCTNNESIVEKVIPNLLLRISCGISFLFVMSLMINTLIKPLLTNKC